MQISNEDAKALVAEYDDILTKAIRMLKQHATALRSDMVTASNLRHVAKGLDEIHDELADRMRSGRPAEWRKRMDLPDPD